MIETLLICIALALVAIPGAKEEGVVKATQDKAKSEEESD